MISLDVVVTKGSLNWYTSNLLLELQSRKFKRGSLLAELNKWTQKNLGLLYSDIVVLEPNELAVLKNRLDALAAAKVNTRGELLLRLRRIYACYASTRSGIGQKKTKISAFDYIARFNGLTCPYCNINVIDNNLVKGKRTSQIDHFYSQSDYPLLSMCFYNLIPACSTCNHTKLDQQIEANPHEPVTSSRSEFSIVLKKPTQPEKNFSYEIKCRFDSAMTVNEGVFGVLGLYNVPSRQSEYQSFVGRMSAFTPDKFDYTADEHPRLNIGLDISFEDLFDVSLNRSEFIKKPFAKMRYDALKIRYRLP